MKKNILFLCTGNSCRSQMAEGWGRVLKGEKFQFYSAGTKKHGLNPRAVAVMREADVDISRQQSQLVSELPDIKMDYVFTVCSDAHEQCPFFQKSTIIIHTGFDDPPRLTKEMSEEDEILAVYRRVRDEIRQLVLHIESYVS